MRKRILAPLVLALAISTFAAMNGATTARADDGHGRGPSYVLTLAATPNSGLPGASFTLSGGVTRDHHAVDHQNIVIKLYGGEGCMGESTRVDNGHVWTDHWGNYSLGTSVDAEAAPGYLWYRASTAVGDRDENMIIWSACVPFQVLAPLPPVITPVVVAVHIPAHDGYCSSIVIPRPGQDPGRFLDLTAGQIAGFDGWAAQYPTATFTPALFLGIPGNLGETCTVPWPGGNGAWVDQGYKVDASGQVNAYPGDNIHEYYKFVPKA